MPVFAIPAKKPLAFFAGASLLLCASVFYPSCRGATQVRVEILTDASCDDLGKTPIPVAVVYVGKDGHAVESIAGRIDPAASSFKCEPVSGQTDGSVLNYLGSLYVTPAGDRDAPFAFSVVAGIAGKNTSECGKPADPAQPNDPKRYEQCIVSRRALNFIEHDSLRLPVFLSLDCAGVACGATTTCRKGECVDATIPDLDLCKTELGCGEDTLDAGGGTGGAGGGGSGGGGTGGGGTGGSGTGGAGGAGGGGPADKPCAVLAMGSEHSCALKSDGTLLCWGNNANGELGDGTIGGFRTDAAPVINIGKATHVNSTKFHACASDMNGEVWCWGMNDGDQLGPNGTLGVSTGTPLKVTGVSGAVQIAVGRAFSCALINDGTVSCWGSNTEGQRGPGAVSGPNPSLVMGAANLKTIHAGSRHICGITNNNSLFCWGGNGHGQLGNGAVTMIEPPQFISGTDGVLAYSTGGYSYGAMNNGAHSCAVFPNSVQCWGSNSHGELGHGTIGTIYPNPGPVVPDIMGATRISSGRHHACALLASTGVACWGENGSLQVGNGAGGLITSPFELTSFNNLSDVAAGGNHTCALKKSGELYCWGANGLGQLGFSGANTDKPTLSHAVCP